MSSWSPIRRSRPSICRLHIIQRLQIRSFDTPSLPPPTPPPTITLTPLPFIGSKCDTSFQQNRNSLTPFQRWISGIVSGSTIGLALYWYSPENSFLSFAESAAAVTTTQAAIEDQSTNPKFLFGDAYRRKIFFNYEKRLRMRSPPEKVFEYFASFRTTGGEVFMTPGDLMRAVVPVFPPSDSNFVRDGYLRGERSPGELRCAPSEFFMLFDTNDDGLISFKEYIFFVTLLSIPESSFSVAFKMFDLDCNE
ncbi:unnamed protein product [Ilex paraguariensis]|uniref:EF-hand domain-containing protein n=1 Tax=Ilex paraguariensis TaxID=185542 RepID=A0ABC8T0B5_9AQUA